MIPSSIIAAVGSLMGILALLGLAARLYQTGLGRRTSMTTRSLSLRETIALDPRRRLHLVEIEGKRVILLTGGGQDLVVGWIPGP